MNTYHIQTNIHLDTNATTQVDALSLEEAERIAVDSVYDLIATGAVFEDLTISVRESELISESDPYTPYTSASTPNESSTESSSYVSMADLVREMNTQESDTTQSSTYTRLT